MNISTNVIIARHSYDVMAIHAESSATDTAMQLSEYQQGAQRIAERFESEHPDWIAISVLDRHTGEVTTLPEYVRIDTGERCRKDHPMSVAVSLARVTMTKARS